MDLGIAGLRVLVTAGAAGIGLEIARAFMREGARVHVCDVDESVLAALGSSDPALTSSRCDVAERTQVEALFADALPRLGGLVVFAGPSCVCCPSSNSKPLTPTPSLSGR